ncbi:MAG: alpha/beta fold hydrolase [Sulfitobacter sp.]
MLFKVARQLVIALIITIVIALVLVLTQSPKPPVGQAGLDFSDALTAERADPAPLQSIPMRDGYPLQVRTYGGADNVPLLVLVHGSAWHGLQFDNLANALQGDADVIVPDLRGHGTAPDRRGDVDYIGQLEDDLADMIAAVVKPGQKVIMGGHSSGGGLVVRFAGGSHGAMLDGAVLLAPYLKYNAPTTREDSGGWVDAATRRIIGLGILNSFGITALNRLPVVAFNMPQEVIDGPLGDTATLSYTHRLNTSFAPRQAYLEDVAALPPFVVLAGGADEAFISSQYAPTMGAVTNKGRYDMILGATHLGLVDDPRTRAIIAGFLNDI